MYYPNLSKFNIQPKGYVAWTTDEFVDFLNKVRAPLMDELKEINYKIVCVGECCYSRKIFNWFGIKKLKKEGELTHPFDICSNSTKNWADCIREDFKGFTDVEYLKNNSQALYGGDYPHEENDLIENNAAKFRIKYLRRIANFYEDVYSGKHIIFVNVRDFNKPCEDINKKLEEYDYMADVLSDKFNNISYTFIVVNDCTPKVPSKFDGKKNIYLYQPKPYNLYKWHEYSHILTDVGADFSLKLALSIKEEIQKINSATNP
jgi:hypothetical protein